MKQISMYNTLKLFCPFSKKNHKSEIHCNLFDLILIYRPIFTYLLILI